MIERNAFDLGLVDLARRTGPTVRSGPFEGMKLDIEAFPQHGSPKFCGSYEDELHEAVERVIERDPELVINIGCAEGYYAVGFAMRMRKARVLAFDADPRARSATRINATLNQVEVEVSGALTKKNMRKLLENNLLRTLIIMDCEGCEFKFLDFDMVASLKRTDIIVELHPHLNPNCEERILGNMESSHSIMRFVPRSYSEKVFRAPKCLSQRERCTAVNERRSYTPWLLLLHK